MLTLPFGAGVVAAFIFLLFELLVFPVLMNATSTLASYFVVRRAAMLKPIQIRVIPYPLWNEGLFHRLPSHLFLFLFRLVCIVVPVYLETRFISHSNPIPVSKLLRDAYVLQPKYYDIEPHAFLEGEDTRDVVLQPVEVFSRCATVDDDGWVIAKVASVTSVGEHREQIQCVTGTEKALYRTLERLPPSVEPSDVANEFFVDRTPVYRPNLTVEVWKDEGPFKEFAPWPHVQDDNPNQQYFQLKNVTVLDAKDFQCFFWRAPISEEDYLSEVVDLVYEFALNAFICQNVTGRVVDFYFASVVGLTNEDNTRVLERGHNMVSKQSIVSTTFKFLGSLEFKDEIVIDAGHLSRHADIYVPNTRSLFSGMVRAVLYTKDTNVTVQVPGDERTLSVELDGVVMVGGATEVIVVLLLGSILAVTSRFKWKDMQRANTVDGLSYIWAMTESGRWSDSSLQKNAPIALHLKKYVYAGEERFMYDPVVGVS